MRIKPTKVDLAMERANSYKFSQSKGDMLNESEEALVILAKEVRRLRKKLK